MERQGGNIAARNHIFINKEKTTMTKTEIKELASLILSSAQAHGESFDTEAAKNAEDRAAKERADNPNNFYAGMVDFRQFYRKTLNQACTEVAGEDLGQLIYLLLFHAWNDALDWADENAKG